MTFKKIRFYLKQKEICKSDIFFQKQPIEETYQTITDCSFWQTDLQNVQNNFHKIPDFREFSRLLFVINYAKLHDRLVEIASEKAETRYMNLVKNKPPILQNVPLKVIASYFLYSFLGHVSLICFTWEKSFYNTNSIFYTPYILRGI